jgi:mannose-6-phosphate isomerase-like protein (cupin superfamily)
LIKPKPTDHEPFVETVRQTASDNSGYAVPQLVKKRWRTEHIYFNREYCMKRIHIHSNASTSMHFHVDKHETLLCVEGQLGIEYLDRDANSVNVVLNPGEAFVVSPGFPHRLFPMLGEPVTLVESSTYDHPDDSVRIKMEQ